MIQTHELKCFAPQASALRLSYNRSHVTPPGGQKSNLVRNHFLPENRTSQFFESSESKLQLKISPTFSSLPNDAKIDELNVVVVGVVVVVVVVGVVCAGVVDGIRRVMTLVALVNKT